MAFCSTLGMPIWGSRMQFHDRLALRRSSGSSKKLLKQETPLLLRASRQKTWLSEKPVVSHWGSVPAVVELRIYYFASVAGGGDAHDPSAAACRKPQATVAAEKPASASTLFGCGSRALSPWPRHFEPPWPKEYMTP